jgi:hypothetical protein
VFGQQAGKRKQYCAGLRDEEKYRYVKWRKFFLHAIRPYFLILFLTLLGERVWVGLSVMNLNGATMKESSQSFGLKGATGVR